MRAGKFIASFLSILMILSLAQPQYARATQNDQYTEKDGIIEQIITQSPIHDNSTTDYSDPDLENGFPVQTWFDAGTYMGGPAINTRVGNIDADPQLEILVTGLASGPLYAFNYDGTAVAGWPAVYYDRSHYTTIGNLDNQTSQFEVFTGQFVRRVPMTPPGPMLAYDGNGNLLPGWPKDSAYDIWGPAILADVNGDTVDEIFQYEGDFLVHAYLANGEPLPGWPESGEDPSYAMADLDHDGDLEIVTFNNWSSDGADLIAYHHYGTPVNGFNLRFQPYRHPFPVIGDVDGDRDNEIIVFTYLEDDPYFALLIVGPVGSPERTIPLYTNATLGEISASPALADMDGDNIPEIVLGCGAGIIVFQGDGTVLEGFPVIWGSSGNEIPGEAAPVVGDVDGDQLPDIVMASHINWNIKVGTVHVYNARGQSNPHFPKTLNIGAAAVPAIADLDLDGRNEIIITGSYWDGRIEFFDKVWVYDLQGTNHGGIEWGQIGGGPQHWGLYPTPPTIPGIDLYLSMPGTIRSEPYKNALVNTRYGNTLVPIAASVTLTATLDLGLVYLSDTSGITPTVDGETVIWHLPDAGFQVDRHFEIYVQLPADAAVGDHFQIGFTISGEQNEVYPEDNSSLVDIVVGWSSFIPIIDR